MGEDLRTGAGRISTKKTKKKKEWKKVKHLSFVARLLYFAVSLGRTRKKRSLQIGSTFRPCRTFYQERKKNTWKNRCCCCLGVLKRILFDEVKRGGFAAVGKRKRIRERERESRAFARNTLYWAILRVTSEVRRTKDEPLTRDFLESASWPCTRYALSEHSGWRSASLKWGE